MVAYYLVLDGRLLELVLGRYLHKLEQVQQ